MDELNTRSGVADLVRAPLFHFLVLGALVFGVYALNQRDRVSVREEPERLVVVSADRIDALREGWLRTWRRPPTEAELRGLIDGLVREEILSREAVALGLDREDTIVRRRLAQKMDFLARDLLTPSDPTDEQLAAFLAENADRYRRPVRVSFRQVFFSPSRRGASARADAEAALEALRKEPEADLDGFGDAVMLPARVTEGGVDEVAGRFGGEFAGALPELPVGEWAGPVASTFGLHLVRVSGRLPAELPALEEIRAVVARDYAVERRDTANRELYEKLREQYRVEVDEDAARAALSGSSR